MAGMMPQEPQEPQAPEQPDQEAQEGEGGSVKEIVMQTHSGLLELAKIFGGGQGVPPAVKQGMAQLLKQFEGLIDQAIGGGGQGGPQPTPMETGGAPGAQPAPGGIA
jgi:hypothetical protein